MCCCCSFRAGWRVLIGFQVVSFVLSLCTIALSDKLCTECEPDCAVPSIAAEAVDEVFYTIGVIFLLALVDRRLRLFDEEGNIVPAAQLERAGISQALLNPVGNRAKLPSSILVLLFIFLVSDAASDGALAFVKVPNGCEGAEHLKQAWEVLAPASFAFDGVLLLLFVVFVVAACISDRIPRFRQGDCASCSACASRCGSLCCDL